MEPGKEESNLEEFYKSLSFLKLLETSHIPEWQKEVIYDIWKLKLGRKNGMVWTDENLTELIKATAGKYRDILEKAII